MKTKTKTKIYLSNEIAVYRAKQKITQQELADAVDVTRATIVAIEGEGYNPSLELAFRIANYFNLTIDELFFIKEH